jgi:hypothetical protein
MNDTFTTIHHLHDVPWYEAKLPRRWHLCKVQTWGMVGMTMYGRCACGAIRSGLSGYWMEKNSRRRHVKA